MGFHIQLPHLTVEVSPTGRIQSVLGVGKSGTPRQLAIASATSEPPPPHAPPETLMVLYFADAVAFPPYGAAVGTSAVQLNGSSLLATFKAPDGKAVQVMANLAVGAETAVLAVTGLSSASSVPIRQIDFLRIPVRGLVRCAYGLAGAYDDDFAMFTMMGDLEMDVLALGAQAGQQCGMNGTVLTARVAANIAGSWWNRSVVLWGGSGAQLRSVVQQAERQFGLPSPTIKGQWSKNSLEAHQGYWLIDVRKALATKESSRKMIELAVASGVTCLCLVNWAQTAGHYQPSTAVGGLPGLVALANKLRSVGLSVGLHTMSDNIACTPTLGCDSYVSPIPDPRLAKSPTIHTLAVAMTSSASVGSFPGDVMLNTSTTSMPATGTLQIGSELITYSGRTLEFGKIVLSGIRRGAHNTTAAAHPAGSTVFRLLPSFMGFLPQPGTDLMDEIAGNIATVFKAVGATLLYFDGAEVNGMPGHPYGESQMCHAFAQQLQDVDAIYQASSGSSYCWHLTSRRGQTDWGAIAVRSFWDTRKAPWVQACKDNLMTPDVGWGGLTEYSPGSWLATTPQEMEFLASKAVAFGGAVSLEMAGGPDGLSGGVTTNGRALEAAAKMGRWLKHNISFPPDVLVTLQQSGFDHELTQDTTGGFWVTPVKMHDSFVANPRVPASLSASLPASFPSAGPDSFSVRVRAETAVARLGDPANIVLVSEAATDHLVYGCPTNFASTPGQIPVPIPIGNLTIQLVPSPPPTPPSLLVPAKSLRFSYAAPTVSGMGCARFTFQKPALNLTAHRPLGVLVHGDGSGALVDIQLEESRGLIQSHFMRLDFAGWRTVELDQYETSGLFTTLFPRTSFPNDLRGFDLNAVVALNVYVTNATQAQIEIGAIESLFEDSQASRTSNATITVDGTSLHLPDGLNAAVCLPGTNYSHNGPSGGCSDYAECELGTKKCRSFDADNVELNLPQSDAALPDHHKDAGTREGVIAVSYNTTSVGRVEVTVFERGPRLGPFY